MILARIGELAAFVRLKVCLGIALLTFAGFLASSAPAEAMLLATLSIFLTFCAGYAHNNISDVKEDIINRGSASPLALNRKAGFSIVIVLHLLGLIAAYMVNMQFTFLVLLILLLSITYSHFRVKRFTAIKNVYSGLVVGLAYLGGGLAAPSAAANLFGQYILVSLYVIVLSFISDIRDIPGDSRLSIGTIAALLGESKSILLAALLLLLLSALILTTLPSFITLLPFLLAGLFLLMLKKYELSHFTGTLAFLTYIGARLAGG